MHKWAMFILFIASAALGLSVIAFAPPTNGVVEMPQAQENEVQFIMTNFQFDQPEYTVQVGETKVLTMINKQGKHGVLIDGLGIDLTPDSPSQEVTFDQPGEYTLYCSIMCGLGHNDMVAKLVVVEASGDDAAEDGAVDTEQAAA